MNEKRLEHISHVTNYGGGLALALGILAVISSKLDWHQVVAWFH
jgi:hypothetical protein